MPYVIAEPCVSTCDGACVPTCPVDAIHRAPDQFVIDPDACICCGACEPACPVKAIYDERELPRAWASAADKNAAHFKIKR